jgi:hypothetical protein
MKKLIESVPKQYFYSHSTPSKYIISCKLHFASCDLQVVVSFPQRVIIPTCKSIKIPWRTKRRKKIHLSLKVFIIFLPFASRAEFSTINTLNSFVRGARGVFQFSCTESFAGLQRQNQLILCHDSLAWNANNCTAQAATKTAPAFITHGSFSLSQDTHTTDRRSRRLECV